MNDRKTVLSNIFDDALDLREHSSCSLLRDLEMISEHYTDLEFYQQGGSKTVYKAFDERTGRQVAYAQLADDATEVQQDAFLREARINAMLQHPNIVPVYDIGTKDGKAYFCMKFVEGFSLAKLIESLKQDSQSLTITEILDIYLKVCDAIAYAHDRGVVHLDLKPDNIQIDDFGDLRVCDWGLAQILDGHDDVHYQMPDLEKYSFSQVDLNCKTLDGYIKGSPGFMAPEQTGIYKHSKSVYTDTYSLTCILYALLTLEVPFPGKDLQEVLEKTAKSEFTAPSKIKNNIPKSLEAICLKGMSLSPEERYQKVDDLKQDILAYRNGYATSAENAKILDLFKLFIQRNKLLSLVTLCSCFVLASASFLFIHRLQISNQEALKAKNAALESREEALELNERYRQEKIQNQKRGKELSEQFVEKYYEAYKEYNFPDAMEYINSAVAINPKNKIAWLQKARLLCVHFQFKESYKAFNKSPQNSFLYDVAKRYKDNENIDLELKLKIISEAAQHFNKRRPASDFIQSQIYGDLTLEERIKFIRAVLKIYNPEQKIIHFEYSDKTQHLDISGNHEIKWAYCLKNFPAKSVNISNSGIDHLENLKDIPLQRLNISNTYIRNFDGLDIENLQVLNISSSDINDLPILSQSSIRELDISHCKINSIYPILQMKFLRKLTINKGQFPKGHFKNLNKRVQIRVVD